MKAKYEMHVYTMGTRAYALEVCKSIDPDGTVFGQRVLTRDESGSMCYAIVITSSVDFETFPVRYDCKESCSLVPQ